MVNRARRPVAFVLMFFAMHSALGRTQAPPSQSQTVLSSNVLDEAWSLDGARGGVVGDSKTGLIYAATRLAQITEIDSAGTIRRHISLPRSPTEPDTRVLRLAHFAGDNQPTLLAFGVWSADVRAFDLNGNQLWTYPNPNAPGAIAIDDVNVVDLNGDGTDEVIIGFNGATGLRVIDSKGRLAWQSTSIGNVWHVAGGDVLGNGSPQVIATSWAVHVFSNNGSERKDIRPGFYANMVRAGKIPETASAATIFAMGNVRDITTVAALSGSGSVQWSLRLQSSAQAGVRAAWLAPTKPWLAMSLRGGAVYVIDVERGAVIGSVDDQGAFVEVGWSGNEANGSPLLLVSGDGKLTAYYVTATTR